MERDLRGALVSLSRNRISLPTRRGGRVPLGAYSTSLSSHGRSDNRRPMVHNSNENSCLLVSIRGCVQTTRIWILLTLLVWVGAAITDGAVTPATVRAAAAYSASRGGKSFLAIQHGKTLFEQSAREPRKIYSGTKAFWGLTALAAAEDGLLRLDEPVSATIPAWRNDPRKAQVTIRQLLDFSCGLEPVFRLHNNNPGDRDAIAIAAPMAAAPGSAFIYGPSPLQVFHRLLKEKLHGETPTHYLERRVLHRLGLGSQRYLNDAAGNPLLAAGWELSARQWAKIGQLVLADGSPVINSNSLAQCWRGSSANHAFSLDRKSVV